MNAAHTPTPRTDAFFDALYKDVPDEMTELSAGQEREFARELERELAEARESEASEARWAAQYKQERDVLAVALRELMFDCLRFRIEPSNDAYKNAESSLAALEGSGSNPAQKSPPTTP